MPPYLAGSYDVQGSLDALVRESIRLEAARDSLRANFYPQTAEAQLGFFESLLKLTVEPFDKTLAQRRSTVIAFLQKLKSSGSGADWETNITRLMGTGWTYSEHVVGDPSTPAGNTITISIPYSAQIPSPTGLVATPGTGGGMPAGTYHYRVTATNFYGETAPTAEVTATVAINGRVTLNWADVVDATGYSVYRGLGANLTRIAQTPTSDFVDNNTAAGTVPPPAANTTESFQAREIKSLARKITPAHVDLFFDFGGGFIIGLSELGHDAM